MNTGPRRLIPKPLRQRVRSLLAYPDTLRMVTGVSSFRTLRRLENSTHRWNGVGEVSLRIRELNGAPVVVRPATDDRYVLRDVFFGRSHLPPPQLDGHELRLITDLGAHIGMTAAHLAAAHPRARVIAVEADPANAALCRRNLAHLGGRATVEEAAIWADDGEMGYAVPSDNTVGGRVAALTGQETDLAVRALSMNTLLARRCADGEFIDYLKLDIEGAEGELFRRNTEWMERVQSLKVEVHPPYTVPECLRDLDAAGFDARVTEYIPGHGMPVVDGIRRGGPYADNGAAVRSRRRLDARSPERLRAHYEVERELADRLRGADAEERRRLYGTVYDELYRRVPDHPRLTRDVDRAARAADVDAQVTLLGRFLSPSVAFLAIGTDARAVSAAVAGRVARVGAADVFEEVSRLAAPPPDLSVVISDGVDVPVAPESVDVAYSNQVMERLHPDDARVQMENVRRVLTPGGVYVCVTLNRLSGPHDISVHFDEIATGLHLHEYTIGELRSLLRASGFARVRVVARVGRRAAILPAGPVAAVERLLSRLPRGLRRRVATEIPLRSALSTVVALKPR